jgi:hypothetical protein
MQVEAAVKEATPRVRAVKSGPLRLPASLERFSVRADSYAYAGVDVTMPVGHTIEDALKSEYWALHAHKMLKPQFSSGPDWAGAVIYLRTDDHALYCQLYVRAVKQGGLDVAIIGTPARFGPEVLSTGGYEHRWNVGKRGYDIIRKSDRSIVADGRDVRTRDDVQKWIDESRKS